jgi:hypothetical protein
MRKQTLLKSWLLLFALIAGSMSVWAEDTWVKTAPADLQTGDVVVIVDQTTSKAMSNSSLNSKGAPNAIAVNLSSDKSTITFTATGLEWEVTVNVTGDSKTFNFGVPETDNYLYAVKDNNGLRVGTGETNVCGIENNGTADYITITDTENAKRYIGVYSNTDWRCYTSINSNISQTATAFYKKTSASGPVDPIVTISKTTITVGGTAEISGPDGLAMTFSSSNTSVATVSNNGVVTGVAKGEATITASWSAVANTYNAGSKAFVVNVVDATVYEMVTDASQLVAGNEYIIVATGYNKAMGNQNSSIRVPVDVTITDGKVSITNEAIAVLTLDGSTDAWTFLASDNDKYLALTSSSNAIHASDDATANASKWKITEDFELESVNFSGRKLKYNSGSPRFACYASGQQTAVLFVKSGSSTDTKPEPGFSFSATSAEVTLGEEFTAPTFSNPNNVEVTFASSDESVATINTQGVVTIVAAGTTTISATSEETDTYRAGSASYTLTVIDPNGPGTEDNPYTVEQARAAIDAGTGTQGVYATGIVSKIVTAYNSQYENISFNISADGSTTADQLEAYRCLGSDEYPAADVQIGDEVVIYGNLTKYNTTYEFAQGCQIISLIHHASTEPSVTVDPTTVEAPADGAEDTIDVTYTNFTEVVADVYFCDADGEAAEYDWLDAEINSSDATKLDYVISANTGSARTAYMKVYALDDDGEEVYSGLITITQAAYVAPADGYYVKVTSTDDITDGQYLIVYEEGSVAFDGGLTTLDATFNTIEVVIDDDEIAATSATRAAEFTIDVTAGTLQSASGKYIGVSSNSNGLKTSDDAETYTNAFSIDDNENAVIAAVFEGSNMTLQFNADSNQKRFRYMKNANKAIQLYKFVSSNTVTASVSQYKWATFSSEYDLDFTDVTAVEAHIVTGAEGSTIVTEKVEGTVAAGTGLLLYSETPVENVEIPVAEEAGVNYSNMNKLVAVTEDNTTINKAESGFTNYVLAVQGGKAVFAYIDEVPATLNKGKAYLMLEGDAPAPFLGFDGEDTTGINSVERGALSVEECYTLDGRRVAQPTKGLYIVNGKKVMVK